MSINIDHALNVVAVADAATNAILVLSPKGTGALVAQNPDNAVAGGNVRGANAVDWQTTRTAAGQVASGANSTVLGGWGNQASGGNAIAGGAFALAQGSSSIALGETVTASGTFGVALGGLCSDRGAYGKQVYASGRFAANGDAQSGRSVLRRQTTDATTTALTTDGAAGGSTNMVNLPNNSAFGFVAIVVGTQTGGTAGTAGDTVVYHISFAGKRGASAAATVQLGSATVSLNVRDAALTTAGVSVIADTTNGAIGIFVNGEVNKNMNWVARVMTVETTR